MLLKVVLFDKYVFHVAKVQINAISTLQNKEVFLTWLDEKKMFDSRFNFNLPTFVHSYASYMFI